MPARSSVTVRLFTQNSYSFSRMGILDVNTNHLRKQWRLRSIFVIATSAVGHEANIFDKIHEILDDVFGNLSKGPLSTKEAFDDPEGVPVIWLPETTASYHEGTVDRKEGVNAARAVSSSDRRII